MQESADGVPVDVSDFLLHEAQAQLQLALLGMPEDMETAAAAAVVAVVQVARVLVHATSSQ